MVKDEVGNKYGRLTVISRGENDKQGNACWYCQCDCGNPNLYLVKGYALRNGHTKSCGCLHQETAKKQGIANRKTNTYDLTGEYGIGYSLKGEPFYFDLEDYELIKNYCWHLDKNGYVVCKRKKLIFMHRLVTDAPDDMIVDHIYHKVNDNRKKNLRICTHSDNQKNRKISNSSSGMCGVYWYSKQQKWSAEIGLDGTNIRLGLFDNLQDAIKARKEAEKKYYKEFRYKEENEGSDDAYER